MFNPCTVFFVQDLVGCSVTAQLQLFKKFYCAEIGRVNDLVHWQLCVFGEEAEVAFLIPAHFFCKILLDVQIQVQLRYNCS